MLKIRTELMGLTRKCFHGYFKDFVPRECRPCVFLKQKIRRMKPRETISCGEKREEPTGKKKYKNWIVCSLYVTGHFSLIEEIFQQTLSAYEKKNDTANG